MNMQPSYVVTVALLSSAPGEKLYLKARCSSVAPYDEDAMVVVAADTGYRVAKVMGYVPYKESEELPNHWIIGSVDTRLYYEAEVAFEKQKALRAELLKIIAELPEDVVLRALAAEVPSLVTPIEEYMDTGAIISPEKPLFTMTSLKPMGISRKNNVHLGFDAFADYKGSNKNDNTSQLEWRNSNE